jgi:hypothetical protein
MSIPPFTTGGDLPAGIHVTSLHDVMERFGTSTARRTIIATRLERIYRLAIATGDLARFVVFGSFVTAKPEPGDVDVFMLMEDRFDSSVLTGEARLLFDHGAADTFFGASVFWLRRLAAFGGEEATLGYWQTRRDGGLRGIVEIVREEG